MRLRGPTHLRLRRLDDDAARQHVCGHHQQSDEQHRQEQPVEHERDERQLEHVEADVVAEVAIGDAERLAVAEHQPVLPTADGGHCEQEPEHDGDREPEDAHAVPEELVEALDQRVRVGRERSGRQPIGDDEVQQRKHHERAREHGEHGELGTQHAPEHVGTTHRLVPQVVDEETGEEASGEQQPDERDRKNDEQHPATIAEATGLAGSAW